MHNLSKAPVRLRLFVMLALGLIGFAAIIYTSVAVARDLRLLNSAQSDNVQWTLSQAEVEFLGYELQLSEMVDNATPDLKALRREFDIFFSRISTLRQASAYSDLRDLPEFSRNLGIVDIFLTRSAALIDGSDAELISHLPDLRNLAREARPHVRRLSNSGLAHFATDADQRRNDIAVTLAKLAGAVAALLVTLLLLVFYLGYLNAQNVRRRAEIQQASDRMKIVTSTALDAVIVSDTNGRILDFNTAAEQIFGHKTENAIGADLGALIVPDHHREAHAAGLERMRMNGEKRVVGKGRVRLEAKRANGEIFPVECAIQSAETDGGEIFIAFLRDISPRLNAEAELVAARDRALAGEKAKTDFLATMSHEIRTPLNGLLGNLALLRDTRLNAKQMRSVKNMETSGKLLLSHISDVLDITKYDAGKLRLRPVAMNISTLLQDIVDNQSGAASANNTTLEWGWVDDPANWICADRDRIQHILMNIIGNAVKFTKDGRIKIEAELLQCDVEVPQLQITVSDTGIGMDPELQSQIFDDFMTGDNSYDREVGGTGLGLGIAKRFVAALGGEIEVESELEVGSTFAVRFPVELIEAPAASVDRGDEPTSARPRRILVVEDNEINRVVAREMLTAVGHEVTEAPNGKRAVEIAEAQAFDLIFMDISMPLMDGRQATREIRAGKGASAKTPIVALTANAMPEEQEAFLSDGMNDILTKPLTREGLLGVVSNHTDSLSETTVSGPVQASPVAQAYLNDLRDTLGRDALGVLLEKFVTEVDDTLAYLENHSAHKTADIVARAHRIAGSSAALGAVELRSGLLKVENAAKSGDADAMVAAIDALPNIWAATRRQIRADRPAGATP